MLVLMVNYDIVKDEFEYESNKFIEILRNSDSKYKNIELDKIKWSYSFSFFINKSDNTPEYYDKLMSLPYNDRLIEEFKKIRLNLDMAAGHFYLSDRVKNDSNYVKKIVESLTISKMISEYEFHKNDEVFKTIPNIDYSDKVVPSLDEQLKKAIEIEDYEEAARIRDLIQKI